MRRGLRMWSLAPVVAVAAVLTAPCDCPDHRGGHSGAVASSQQAAHVHPAPAAAVAPASASPAGHRVHANHADDDGSPAFEVGTADRPLVTRGPRGPLWKASKLSAPGTGPHGTPAQRTVAAQLEALRDPAASLASAEPAAKRTILTTRQATQQLSKRCQRLIKAKRNRLSRAELRRRLACVRLRRSIVRQANEIAPGVAAPAPAIQGPTPTTAPPTTTEPTPTDPVATTPGDPTPTTPGAPAKKYAAAGVIAVDGDVPFQLTRASATADIVNFELDNTDRQDHDLYIAPANSAGEITGAPVQIIGRIDGGERASADVELAPGVYRLICTVPGHGPMSVKFTVYAPTPA